MDNKNLAIEQLSSAFLNLVVQVFGLSAMEEKDILAMRDAIAIGNTDIITEALGKKGGDALRGRENGPSLFDLVMRLSKAMGRLLSKEARDEDMVSVADVAAAFGELYEDLEATVLAHDFYEIAYNLYIVADHPALACAHKLRSLSDPEKEIAYHAAIWRLATELVRHAAEKNEGWLEALDAVELALTCPVEDVEGQRALGQSFFQQLRKVSGTKFEELISIYFVQAPKDSLDPEMRMQALMAASGFTEKEASLPEAKPVLEMLAVIKAQASFDDMRQMLRPVEEIYPHIDLLDVNLRHKRLASAVPLGSSLIANMSRTRTLLLDVTHEICHALALLGPVGVYQSAFRAVVNYLECILISRSPQKDLLVIEVLTELPDELESRWVARLQIQAVAKASYCQAVWTPWLEGLSMYFELLCDPKEDPTEISPVHECVRSLIDFLPTRVPGESDEDFLQRRANLAAAEFEEFFSKAIKSTARLATIGYFDGATNRTRSDFYVLGYLVVRSVVAAWEKTLGKRLVPAEAAKLLLHATQFGTVEAFPSLQLSSNEFLGSCRAEMIAWVSQLASLPKSMIEDFLVPVGPNEARQSWCWNGPKLEPTSGKEAEAKERADKFDVKLKEEITGLAGMDFESTNEALKRHCQRLLKIFAEQVMWNRFLPVGHDESRLLFLQDSFRAGLCPRTYTGERQKGEDAYVAKNSPRYSPRFWPVDGKIEEQNRLRRVCGRAGSGRMTTTRIIDLTGHSHAPHRKARTSYACFFLGSDYAQINPWCEIADISQQYPEFAKILETRALSSPAFSKTDDTLGSLPFLIKRLGQKDDGFPDDISELEALDVDALIRETAMTLAAAAFAGGDESLFTTAYSQTMETTGARHAVARVVHSTGLGQKSEEEPVLAKSKLMPLLFVAQSPSGVRPFGDKS